jgi:sugar/nucleoside kinase (ribokinase family)
MGKVISAGHICLDITPVFPAEHRYDRIGDLLVPGSLIRMEAASVHTGGSVGNTGLALKKLGNDVTLLGKIGNDAFGSMVRNILSGYGAGGLIVDEEGSTAYTVVLAVPGIDRIFLHNPGANDTFSAGDIPEEALDGAVLFHFGYPSLMKRMFGENGAELRKMFRRIRGKGIATSLDLAAVDPKSDAGKADWEAILRGVLPDVDFFVPSFEELCYILDRGCYDALSAKGGNMTELEGIPQMADGLARKCLEMGCGAVLVKCGLSGMVWRTGSRERLAQTGERLRLDPGAWAEREGMQPCFRAETVRSATGAGDVSIAAYLTALMNGESPGNCVKLAAAEGAASVSGYDSLSGVLPLEELKQRIAEYESGERSFI